MLLDGKYIEIDRNNHRIIMEFLGEMGYIDWDIIIYLYNKNPTYDIMSVDSYGKKLYLYNRELYHRFYNDKKKLDMNKYLREEKLKRILK